MEWQKRYCYVKMSYFPEPFTNKNKVLVKLNVFNYATKSDIKNAMGVDTLKFAKKDDLINLKTEVDSLDIDKLETNQVNVKKKKKKKMSNEVDKKLLEYISIIQIKIV